MIWIFYFLLIFLGMPALVLWMLYRGRDNFDQKMRDRLVEDPEEWKRAMKDYRK